MPDTFSTPSKLSTPCVTSSVPITGSGALLGLFGSPSPAPTLTLPIADRVRAALMRASDSQVPWQISGKDPTGRPHRGHEHLHILPFSSSALPGRAPGLDRVLLWANGGLDDLTLAVLERLRERAGWVQLRGGPRLRLELLAVGSHDELSLGPVARILGPSRRWRSATSFVPPRFPKRRGGRYVDSPEAQLSRLLAEIHGVEVVEVTSLLRSAEHWRGFEQRRFKRPDEPRRPASGWRVELQRPLWGPLAVGYGAHFGLGRFEVEKDLES